MFLKHKGTFRPGGIPDKLRNLPIGKVFAVPNIPDKNLRAGVFNSAAKKRDFNIKSEVGILFHPKKLKAQSFLTIKRLKNEFGENPKGRRENIIKHLDIGEDIAFPSDDEKIFKLPNFIKKSIIDNRFKIQYVYMIFQNNYRVELWILLEKY